MVLPLKGMHAHTPLPPKTHKEYPTWQFGLNDSILLGNSKSRNGTKHIFTSFFSFRYQRKICREESHPQKNPDEVYWYRCFHYQPKHLPNLFYIKAGLLLWQGARNLKWLQIIRASCLCWWKTTPAAGALQPAVCISQTQKEECLLQNQPHPLPVGLEGWLLKQWLVHLSFHEIIDRDGRAAGKTLLNRAYWWALNKGPPPLTNSAQFRSMWKV